MELYTSRGTTIPPLSEFFQLENNTVLNHDESTSGDLGQLTEKECLEALKSMDSDKPPPELMASLLNFTKLSGRALLNAGTDRNGPERTGMNRNEPE